MKLDKQDAIIDVENRHADDTRELIIQHCKDKQDVRFKAITEERNRVLKILEEWEKKYSFYDNLLHVDAIYMKKTDFEKEIKVIKEVKS